MRMKEIGSTTALYAEGGLWLTDGKAYGREIWLGFNDCPENWREVTEDELPINEPEPL